MSLKRQLSEEELPFFDEMYNLPPPQACLPRRRFARANPYQTPRPKGPQPEPSTAPGTYKTVDPGLHNKFETLKTWIITQELRVSFVACNETDFKIHLRRFDGNIATPQGVTMTSKSWPDFVQKFARLDVLSTDTGFVCNNEVLALVNSQEQVALQNLFPCRQGKFGLKYLALVLSRWEIECIFASLEMLQTEISEVEDNLKNFCARK